ncbi:hypothetical protein C8Q76DRAFT_772517 [Earliella scabrosa]|nr:hypothetical protein C8Q76DRAFT_772517 [Earliella scabrosa]
MGWRETTGSLGTLAVLIPALWIPSAHAGNTTCASGQLEWYSSVVGESPCVTYERLRQICNPDYQVPNFRPFTPGDQCDDQVSACCCNTVAFQLSMLCMNCQYVTEEGNVIGIDAGVGAYDLYRQNCGQERVAIHRQSDSTPLRLPDDIQRAVCNKDIRLDNFVYGGWDDGAWFYVWSKQNAVREHNVYNNNTFTRCPDQISPSVTPTPTSQSTTASDASITSSSQTPTELGAGGPTQTDTTEASGGSNIGPIVGGVVGGVGAIVIAVTVIMFCRLRRKQSATGTRGTPDNHYNYTYQDDPTSPPMTSATPFAASMASHSRDPSSQWPTSGAAGSSASGAPSPESTPWAQSTFSFHSPGPTSPDASLRHEDGGPVPELVRSASGRLPSAYRSWERRAGTEVSGSVSGGGSQISEPQTFGHSQSQSLTSPSSPGLSGVSEKSPRALPDVPLVPLRRAEGTS